MTYPFEKAISAGARFGATGKAWGNSSHTGQDFLAFTGTTVLAVVTGTVIFTGNDRKGGMGVQISSGSYVVSYWHLSRRLVTLGQHVKAGQPIALSGSSGIVTGPHLHITIKKDGHLIDPLSVLASGPPKPNLPNGVAPSGDFHVIRKGDTFWDLNIKYNLKQGTLQGWNPGISARAMPVGRSLRVRAPSTSSKPVFRKTYTIRRGDTFSGLEDAWSLPHGTLQRLNPSLDPRKLAIGQTIRIK